jgi:hypothetical protein
MEGDAMLGESIPKEDYLDHPALGSSAIGVAASQTVAHYLAKQKKEETPSQRLGTLDHTALLEPELLQERYQMVTVCQCDATTGKGQQCSRHALLGARHCRQHGGQGDVDLWHLRNPGKELIGASLQRVRTNQANSFSLPSPRVRPKAQNRIASRFVRESIFSSPRTI